MRDHDGSVVQFRYGEDGFDVGRATFINPKLFKFLEDNSEAVLLSSVPQSARNIDWGVKQTEKHFKRLSKWKKARLMAQKTEKTSESCKIFILFLNIIFFKNIFIEAILFIAIF